MKVIKQLIIFLILFICIVFPSIQTNAETVRSSYTDPIVPTGRYPTKAVAIVVTMELHPQPGKNTSPAL